MRATTAAQQLAATGGGPAAAEQELLGWPALTAAAGGGGASAAPAAPPERCLSLARQPTPLLPCGLTAQELAALTAQRASSGGAPDAGSAAEPASETRRSFERVNHVASATAAARQARRRGPPQLPALNLRARDALPAPARQRSASEGQLPQLAPSTPRGSAEVITAAQRLAAISPDLAAATPRGGQPPPAWATAAAAPGSPRALRSSAPAHAPSWQRQRVALEALTGGHSPRAAGRGGGPASAEGPEFVPGSPCTSLQQHAPDPQLHSVPAPSRLAASSGAAFEDGAPPPPGTQLLPVERWSAKAAVGTEEEEEEEAPWPEDPGMGSFSAVPPAVERSQPSFPADPGDGKSAAPHALRQLSPSAASTAAEGQEGGVPATPAPDTPRKKRGLFLALPRLLRF